jgi:hypothetical protein
MAWGLAACESDDTDFSSLTSDRWEDDGSGSGGEVVAVKDFDIDTTPLAESETFSADDNDYVENATFSYQVVVNFDGTTATLSGDVDRVDVSQTGAHVVITSTMKEVEYVLTGTSTNGSLKIYSDYKYKLTLNGVQLTNPTGAAINNQCGKTLYVVVADGTNNMLQDGTTYTMTGEEDQRGTLFSEGQMIFSGKGMLSIYANAKNGIASDDYIRFRPGTNIYVNSTVNNGVKAKDGIYIAGGVLNIEVSGDGAKGLNCDMGIDVAGGRTTVITSGKSVIEANDTSSCAAVKCDSTLTITGGTLNLKSTGEGDKGINSKRDVIVKGGEINVVALGEKLNSSPKGIKADENISISGGYIYSYSAASSPIEAKGTLTVAPGYATYNPGERLWEVYY